MASHVGARASTARQPTYIVLATNEPGENRNCNARRTSPELIRAPGLQARRLNARQRSDDGGVTLTRRALLEHREYRALARLPRTREGMSIVPRGNRQEHVVACVW